MQITIKLPIPLPGIEYRSDEDCHNSLLLFMFSAKSFFVQASCFLGSDWYGLLETLFYSLPDVVLKRSGYCKNINSFNAMGSLLTYMEKDEVLKVMKQTLITDIPNHPELTFLKTRKEI